jgi:hypothetical protein
MKTKAVSAIMLTLLLMSMLTLAFAQVPSATPYTDFHDLLYASSSNLQTFIGFAYESPPFWLNLGKLNPSFIDPWSDNNNFVPASGRLLISVKDIKPLFEQILTVEFDTGSLSKIYVPSTDGTTYWLILWVADDGSTYYDREMSVPARVAPSPAVEATQELIETIETWNLSKGVENCLTSKLNNVIHLLDKRNEKGATHKLIVVVNQVEALRGKKLTIEQAEYLISEAQRIIDLT